MEDIEEDQETIAKAVVSIGTAVVSLATATGNLVIEPAEVAVKAMMNLLGL